MDENRSSKCYVRIDPNAFKRFLRASNMTMMDVLDKLERMRFVDVSERSFRRYMADGRMPMMLAMDICRMLGTGPETAFGIDAKLDFYRYQRAISGILDADV